MQIFSQHSVLTATAKQSEFRLHICVCFYAILDNFHKRW